MPSQNTQWSPFQTAIFAAGTESSDSLSIHAVAGSGKTTTAVELAKRLGADNVSLLAFNKSIAEALVNRGLPNAATFHSAFFGLLKAHTRKPYQIRPGKLHTIAKSIILASHFEDFAQTCKRAVSLAKQLCLTPETFNHENFLHIVNNFALDCPDDTGQAFRYTREIFRRSVEESSPFSPVIDFDDMLYEPWRLGIQCELAPTIIVDEAQDTNELQRALLAQTSARLICVGDPFQAIYGFRGSSATSMDELAKAHNSTRLPLSISYRCASSIVAHAQKIVAQISAAPNAPEGQVLHMDSLSAHLASQHVLTTDAILCRTNAPLLRLFYSLAARNIPCTILGRDMASLLSNRLKSIIGTRQTYKAVSHELETQCAAELQRAEQRQGPTGHIVDLFACLRSIIRAGELQSTPVHYLPASVTGMFSDESSPGQITLSTIHRAKGREWPSVIFYQPELCAPRDANPDWLNEQEQNLKYVAITRAMSSLTFAGK